MKAPRVHLAIFKSRIGKRIFWMFVCCSFIPIITLSGLSYIQVKRQLNDQAVARLRQMTKAIGMSIYERLEFLENEMRLLAHTLSTQEQHATVQTALSRTEYKTQRFQSLQFVAQDGHHILLYGQTPKAPVFTAAEETKLKAGKSIISIIPQNNAPAGILFSIKTTIGNTTPGILIGEVNVAYLWGIGQQYNLPPMTELTIFDHSSRVLISSVNPSDDLIRKSASPLRNASSHHFTWQNDDQVYLACYWDLFLKSRFASEKWAIVLSQTRGDALAIIQNFKFDFPLSLMVGFWVILLVSIRYIRKSLVPLEKLRQGTRRIQNGDFSQAVAVDSNDEFEDLAASFNLMTQQLARTFGELSVMAEMGHFVTTRPEVSDLAMTELRIMADKLDFDWGLLMIEGKVLHGDDVIVGFGLPNENQDIQRDVTFLEDRPLMKQLMTHAASRRTLIFSQDTADLASILPQPCLDFLAQIGCRSLVCVPILFEKKHMGVLAVGKTSSLHPLTENDKDLVASIAAQTAVAINNIISFHQLEESEDRFRQSFDHAATGIALVSLDHQIRASNRYLQQLLGYTEKELAGISLDDINTPEDRFTGREEMDRMIEGELTFSQFENRYRHKDGHAIWARVNGSLLRDKKGKPLHFIFHIQDLTAEKTAENDKRQLENQLRQAQKMEAIGTLAGGIAHDFNNILSAVGGYTELALLKLPEDSDIHDNLSNVKKAADRATDLVRQILAFSRQAEHEKVPLQISSVVKEALQLLRASLPAMIDINQSIDNRPIFIMADPTQIHQIVMNLCTNAMHAMQDDGGTLSVRLNPVTLTSDDIRPERRLSPGDYLKLTIADTGCGMDTQTLERIFDPYFTTKEKGKGTGLGLAVVHGIVENHGGIVKASSTPGQGTTFDIYFPAADQQAHHQAQRSEANPGGTERVLFVDDEPMLVDLGKAMLTKLGYSVTGATDPQEALEIFQQNPQNYDIAITDLTMPGMTGNRLAEKLSAIRPHMPILMCSGYVKDVGQHAILSGYIHKPITLESLARAVREALDHAR
jgi:PAS domain S-box-containing protein